MKIIEKLAEKATGSGLYGAPIPTIAFLGDSVTQGCFEVYRSDEKCIDTVFDRAHAYHTYLAEILAGVFPKAPLNIINAGISGDSTDGALKRLERDVLCHNPDLTVVCFGLNDCNRGMDNLENYASNLRTILQKLLAAGGEVILMTPNMMNTYVDYRLQDDLIKDLAARIAQRQVNGVLDAYMNAARAVADDCGVPVCDVYAKWKRMAELNVNTTALLSNHINHPTREMNYLFAYSLFDTMLS